MNILFSGNDGVFDGILTCMLSIFKRTKVREPFVIYILTMDVSELKPEYIPVDDAKIAFLQEVAKEYHPQNKIIKMDVTELYEREFAHCPNERCYCSPYTLLRLFIDLIPEIPDKILYLENGHLAAAGSHMQLMESCPGYQRMVELQQLEDEGGESHV